MSALHRRLLLTAMLVGLGLLATAVASLWAQDRKPNMLVIWGDDIGTWNISYNNRRMHDGLQDAEH